MNIENDDINKLKTAKSGYLFYITFFLIVTIITFTVGKIYPNPPEWFTYNIKYWLGFTTMWPLTTILTILNIILYMKVYLKIIYIKNKRVA